MWLRCCLRHRAACQSHIDTVAAQTLLQCLFSEDGLLTTHCTRALTLKCSEWLTHLRWQV